MLKYKLSTVRGCVCKVFINLWKYIFYLLYFLLQNSLDSSNLPTYDQMLKYGCWCQLHDENWEVSNKGTPMDHLDNACRSWFKCYECIGMDEESCNGFNNRYG